jgi:hypothetical protein
MVGLQRGLATKTGAGPRTGIGRVDRVDFSENSKSRLVQ